MGLLASCWLITESFLIPDGFLKWFYLSFYINPFFLVFCQILLWLKVLKECLMLFVYPFRIASSLSLFVFVFVKRVFFSFFRSVDEQVYYDVLEPADFVQNFPLQDWEIVSVQSELILKMCEVSSNLDSCPIEEIVDDDDDDNYSVQDSWLNQYLCSGQYCHPDTDIDIDIDICHSSSFRFSLLDFESNESVVNQGSDDVLSPDFSLNDDDSFTFDGQGRPETTNVRASEDDNFDPFHQKYTSRMKFFNLLYHERLHGMRMISNVHLSIGNEFIEWNRVARKRIMRSLECDVEMICVAQCCLLWEALHYQYHKVEEIKFSDNNNNNNCGNYILFQHNIAAKFQEIQILLERFVEDKSCSNDMHKRLCFQSLLQVPDATGIICIEEENKMIGEEGMRATQLLEAIYKCIEALWLYIQEDGKKSFSWMLKTIWSYNTPPVEDPLDLELLYVVTKTLYKKGIMLKDVQGKSKCWLRKKVKPMQSEDEKRNLVFAMIDMKLVHKLLKMRLISTSHLNWCKEKLNNLDFKEGKVFRSCTSLLFPSS